MDDSSGINNFAVGRANEDDVVQGFTVPSHPDASSTTFTWEDMTTTWSKGNSLLVIVVLKMKPKMKLTVLKYSKCFLLTNWQN